MTNRSKKMSPRDKYDKRTLKKRIDAAVAAYLSSGKTIQKWAPEGAYEAERPRSRQHD